MQFKAKSFFNTNTGKWVVNVTSKHNHKVWRTYISDSEEAVDEAGRQTVEALHKLHGDK